MTQSAFSRMKENSGQQALKKLTDEVEKMNKGSYEADERFWTITVDKAGSGSAKIRFLPPHQDEDVPFVKYFSHDFKRHGRSYHEKCLTTLGKDDPVAKFNNELWDAGSYDDEGPERKQARDQKRKLTFVSNILVINDPSNPENNGKVFLYRHGKKLFDRLKDMMYPPEDALEERVPINPYDMFAGVDVNLRAKKVKGYRNYDTTTFSDPKPLHDDEDEMERIFLAEYPLLPEVADTQFKTYEELDKKLKWVLAAKPGSGGSAEDKEEAGETDTPRQRTSTPRAERPAASKVVDEPDDAAMEEAADKAASRDEPAGGDEADEDMGYFTNLANKKK